MADLKEFLLTPVGETRYAFINNPVKFANGEFVTKDVKHSDGIFTITQVFDPSTDEGAEFLATLKDLEEQAMTVAKVDTKNKKKKLVFVSGIKELEGDDSGMFSVKFKTKAASADGTERTIPVLDSGSPPKVLAETPRIGNGSKTIIRFSSMQTQYNSNIYLSLYLNGIQVINLVSPSASMGFSSQSGGFVGSNETVVSDEKTIDTIAAQIEASADNPTY